MTNAKIVVVTNGNYFARLILERLFLEHTAQVAGVVLIRGDYGGRTGFRSLWQVGKRTAFPYTAYKVVQYLMFRIAQKRHQDAWLEVAPMAQTLNIPFIEVTRVNCRDVYEYLSDQQPTVGLSVSCPQRIRTKILGLPTRGFLNIHSSLLPKYAGLAPYFWVLAENQKETGTTVHYMTEQFDEGNILVQRRLSIPQGISAFWLFRELSQLGRDALVEAVHLALQGELGIPQDLSLRSYRSHPSWRAYCSLRRNGFALARIHELRTAIQETLRQSRETLVPRAERP